LKFYARKTVAGLLGVDDRVVSQYADEAGTSVKRSEVGPKARQYSIENVFDIAAHLRKKRLPGKLPMRVITTNIPRGGTGKTLLATNLAVSFALCGLKSLLIDVDYQASATLLMGYDPDIDSASAASRGIPKDQAVDYHLGHLIGLGGTKLVPFGDVVKKPFGSNGPHLIPSDVSLTKLDNELFLERLNNNKSDLTFRKWLNTNESVQDFEVVIFDSGPGFNRVISAALAASHMVIAPVGLERVSDKGLRILSAELQKLRDSDLGIQAVMRIVANSMVNTQRVVSEFQHITSQYPDMVIPFPIRRSEDVPKSYTGQNQDAPLAPFILEYPSSDVTASLKAISSVVFNELWPEVSQ
jgi:chromosome partitioning protein